MDANGRESARGPAIACLYFLYFGGVGVLLPFLPAYLRDHELGPTEVGVLLALTPALALVAPPLWAALADRLRNAERVLTLVAAGACGGLAVLAAADRFPSFFVTLVAYSLFATSVPALIDAIALRHVARTGGAYARLRLFGSLGFVVSSTLYGLVVTRVDESVVLVPLACTAAYFAWSWWVTPARDRPLAERPRSSSILKTPGIPLFLVGACLHWIACAPYHGYLALHTADLGLAPWVVGLSAGLGVLAEVMVMLAYRRFAGGLAPRAVLVAAYAASVVRWLGMSVAKSSFGIVALSTLHGFSFGAFYVASVAYLAAQVPDALRATGQGFFFSTTFGIGGLVGYIASGAIYEAVGGPILFAIAAAVELLALAAAMGMRAGHAEGLRG